MRRPSPGLTSEQPPAARAPVAPTRPASRAWLPRAATLVVLAVAAGLRLWRLDLTIFEVDEAAIVRLAEDIARLGRVPLSGPIFSAGVPSAPHFMYLLAPVIAVSRDPAFVSGAIAVANVLGLAGTVWLGWRAFGPLAGLSAGMLYAVNPRAVFYARHIWQPDILPPLAVVLFIALDLGVVDRRAWWAAAAFPIVALATLVHPAFGSLAPLLLAPAVVLLRSRSWLPLIVGCLAAGLTAIPYVIHHVQTRWIDVVNLRYYSSLHTWIDLDSVRYALGLLTGLGAQNDPTVPPLDRWFPGVLVQVGSVLETVLLASAIVLGVILVVRRDVPDLPRDLSAPGGDLPAQREDRPARRGDLPVQRGDLPAQREDLPTPRGHPPAERLDRPARRGNLPTQRGDLPNQRGHPPGEGRNHPGGRFRRLRLTGVLLWLLLPVLLTVRHTLPLQAHYFLVVYPAAYLLVGAGLAWLLQQRTRFLQWARLAVPTTLAATLAIQALAVVRATQYIAFNAEPCIGTLLPTTEAAEQQMVDLSHRAGELQQASASTRAAVELQAPDSLPLAYALRSHFPAIDLAGAGDIGLGSHMPAATAWPARPDGVPPVLTTFQPRDLHYQSGVQLLEVAYSDRPRGNQRVTLAIDWFVEPNATSHNAFVWDVALVDDAGSTVFRQSGVDHILSQLQKQHVVSWLSIDPTQADTAQLQPGTYHAQLRLIDAWAPGVVTYTDAQTQQIAESVDLGPITVPPPSTCGGPQA